MAKKDKANPYKNKMTLQEVAHAEEYFYYVQCGEDTIVHNGKQTFKKDRAEEIYWDMLAHVKHMRANGSKEERRQAYFGLLNFHMHKLRLH